MIQSAMMFALGFFVSGLAWLALSVALVRRARRLTERRLLASISTRRAEFETERDELRARHAVQMYRLEREVSRVLDMATAHRLEADVKEHDLVSLKAELAGREDDLQEMQARLAAERETTQSLERRHAEAGSALRSVQHTLQLEIKRRMAAEEVLDAVGGATERIRHAKADARGVEDLSADEVIHDYDNVKLARVLPTADAPIETAEAANGGSVVPMPTRTRAVPAETPPEIAASATAAAPVSLLAGEAHGDLGTAIWRAPAITSGPMPPATTPEPAVPGEPSVAELVARRIAPPADAPPGDGPRDGSPNSEARFFDALAEIRALRRAARQAGE
jgi:hypothetical protein